MTREQALAEMERIATAGDEKAYEAFVMEHFKEFPEDVQSKILLGFFSETLDMQASEAATRAIQQQGIEAVEEIEKIKEELSKGE